MWSISNIWVAWQQMTQDVHVTRETKSKISIAKTAFNKERSLFIGKMNLTFKEGSYKVLHLEYSCAGWWNLDTGESGSEIPGYVWNVVLEMKKCYVQSRRRGGNIRLPVCLNVRPFTCNNSASAIRIFMKLIFEDFFFSKICRGNSSFIKIWQE